MADITETEMNDFLKKMSKQSEALKTMVETVEDTNFNSFLKVLQQLWASLNEKNSTIAKLEKEATEDSKKNSQP